MQYSYQAYLLTYT